MCSLIQLYPIYHDSGPASVGTVDMNDGGMNGGTEAGELPGHMDTTEELVSTLDVSFQCHQWNLLGKLTFVFFFVSSWT